MLATLLFASTSFAESPDITVRVTGRGQTPSAAKADAVRNALQYTLKQLVVADRQISGDAVVRDRVFSTVNGYIEAYQEISSSVRDGQHEIEAQVIVSASRIENFLGLVAGGGGEIKGTLLSRELQRSGAEASVALLQKKARGEIFDRSLETFPWSAFQIELQRVDVRKDGGSDKLILTFRQRYDPAFVATFFETSAALAAAKCRPTEDVTSDRVLKDCIREHNFQADPGTVVCFVTNQKKQCLLLEEGDYCDRCNEVNIEGMLFGRFIDQVGANATRATECLALETGKWTGTSGYRLFERTRIGGGGLRIEINADEVSEFAVSIDPSNVDVDRAAYFVGAIGLPMRTKRENGKLITRSLANPDDNPQDACQLVDEAVQRQMVTLSRQ
jgi:hypothetical protein